MLIFFPVKTEILYVFYIKHLLAAYVAFEISGFKRVTFFENFIFDEKIKKLRV